MHRIIIEVFEVVRDIEVDGHDESSTVNTKCVFIDDHKL